jgi:hypothetical protein
MDLIETIKEMNKEMAEKFPEINYGGCGKSSFTLFNLLSKIKGVSNVGISVTWYRDNHDCGYNKIRKIKITDDNVMRCIDSHDWDHIMVKFKYNGKVYYVDPLRIVHVKDLKSNNLNAHYGTVNANSIIYIIRKSGVIWNWIWTSVKKDNEARLVMKKYLRPHFKKGK